MATLLVMARGERADTEDEDLDDSGDEDFESYELYRTFKAQVKVLREDMGSSRLANTSTYAAMHADVVAGLENAGDVLPGKMATASLGVRDRASGSVAVSPSRADQTLQAYGIIGTDRLTADNAWRSLGKGSKFSEIGFEWGTNP